MSVKPSLGKTAKRENVYIKLAPGPANTDKRPYDVVRACCRYEYGCVSLSVFLAYDVRPLSRCVDIPCDAPGYYRRTSPPVGMTQEEVDSWGRTLQAKILNEISERLDTSEHWRKVLTFCEANHVTPLSA